MNISQPHLDPDHLLTIQEAAEHLGVSRSTVWRWCISGRLPAFKIGHEWRIHPAVLAQMARERQKRRRQGGNSHTPLSDLIYIGKSCP